MQDTASVRRHAVLAAYDRTLRRRLVLVALLGIACLAGLFADVATGPSSLSVLDTVRGILWPETLSRQGHVIVWQLRLPIAVMALLVGIALSLAGAEMQTMLHNPLASPMTLGVSAAASFGAALAIVLDFTLPGVPQSFAVAANAFGIAFAATLLLQSMARRAGGGSDTLVLCGIGLFFAFNAGVAFLQFVASADSLRQFVFWSLGSLARSTWSTVAILAVVIAVVVPFSLAASWRMTALRFGDERALSLGIDVRRLRLLSLMRISLLAATAVSFCGAIGFVGLVGPHIARMMIGEDHRFFLPASALCGALMMSLANLAGKAIVPGAVIPIGVVTAFIGLPVFFLLVMRRGGGRA